MFCFRNLFFPSSISWNNSKVSLSAYFYGKLKRNKSEKKKRFGFRFWASRFVDETIWGNLLNLHENEFFCRVIVGRCDEAIKRDNWINLSWEFERMIDTELWPWHARFQPFFAFDFLIRLLGDRFRIGPWSWKEFFPGTSLARLRKNRNWSGLPLSSGLSTCCSCLEEISETTIVCYRMIRSNDNIFVSVQARFWSFGSNTK